MRPQTQPDHVECSNRKPLDFEDSRPHLHRQFLDHEESKKFESEFGHTGHMGCTCTKRNDTASTYEWRRLRSACAFDTSLASHSNVFVIYFCLPQALHCGKYDQTRLVSLRTIAVRMIHLNSKSLASPER